MTLTAPTFKIPSKEAHRSPTEESAESGIVSLDHLLHLRFPQKRRTTERKARKRTILEGKRETPAPSPRAVFSMNTQIANRAKIGDLIRIEGDALAFDPSDERSGVFFIDGSETRSAHYTTVTPELVIAEVPGGLSSGPYFLSLRCSPGGTGYKEGRAEAVFTIE